MNIIFLNIRGIGNNDSHLAFRDMCRLHNSSLVFVVEPMVAYDAIHNWFWRNVHFTNYCLNIREPLIPNLWVVCGSEFVYTVIFVSSQCLVLERK